MTPEQSRAYCGILEALHNLTTEALYPVPEPEGQEERDYDTLNLNKAAFRLRRSVDEFIDQISN